MYTNAVSSVLPRVVPSKIYHSNNTSRSGSIGISAAHLLRSLMLFYVLASAKVLGSIILNLDFENNAQDSSGNNLATQLVGGTYTSDRFGALSAIYFDGVNDYVKVLDTDLFPVGNEDRSVCLFFRNEENKSDKIGNLFSYGKGTSNNQRFSLLAYYNQLGVIGQHNDFSYYGQVPYDYWTQACVVKQNGRTTLYKNGDLVASGAQTLNTEAGTPFYVGRGPYDRTDEYFKGAIDDLIVWDQAIGQTEIREHLLRGLDLNNVEERASQILAYPFYGDTSDYGPYANNGINKGAIFTAGPTGLANTAYYFNGAASIESATTSHFISGNQARTLCATVNPESSVGNIVSIGSGTTVNNRFSILLRNYQIGIIGEGNDFKYYGNVPKGVWSHVCATFDTREIKIYLNAVPIVSTGTTYATDGSKPLMIARNTVGRSDEVFKGAISSLWFSNVALTTPEIESLMAKDFSVPFPTVSPTNLPSSTHPTTKPSQTPSVSPSQAPSTAPTRRPSNSPSANPSNSPTYKPSTLPSGSPTVTPTFMLTMAPTLGRYDFPETGATPIETFQNGLNSYTFSNFYCHPEVREYSYGNSLVSSCQLGSDISRILDINIPQNTQQLSVYFSMEFNKALGHSTAKVDLYQSLGPFRLSFGQDWGRFILGNAVSRLSLPSNTLFQLRMDVSFSFRKAVLFYRTEHNKETWVPVKGLIRLPIGKYGDPSDLDRLQITLGGTKDIGLETTIRDILLDVYAPPQEGEL